MALRAHPSQPPLSVLWAPPPLCTCAQPVLDSLCKRGKAMGKMFQMGKRRAYAHAQFQNRIVECSIAGVGSTCCLLCQSLLAIRFERTYTHERTHARTTFDDAICLSYRISENQRQKIDERKSTKKNQRQKINDRKSMFENRKFKKNQRKLSEK